MIAQLPGRVTSARVLDLHRREEVFDDAAEWAAYLSPHPVRSSGELEALMWDAVHKRVLRALEGRYDTLRPDRRAGEPELEALQADLETDPAAWAEGREEMRLVLEFVRQLVPGLDREVFWVRHTGNPRGAGVLGYAKIAARLDRTESDVRAALRRVQGHLAAYQRLVADGDAFTRKAILALPVPAVIEPSRRPAGWRETLFDWLTRPFGHDAAATATALAGSGSGRGLGTLVVALCLGGGAAGGTYCAVTGDLPLITTKPPTSKAERPAPQGTGTGAAPRPVREAQTQAAQAARVARELAAAERRARARRSRRTAARRQAAAAPGSPAEQRQITQDTRRAERAPASPVAPSASGNDFNFEQSGPEQPAAPAPAPDTGGSEFLP